MKKIILSTCIALFVSVTITAQSFSEVSASMGITQTFGFGELGGGVSFHDFNGDGWDDLTFCSAAGQPMYFFQNNNGNFQAITAPVNLTVETKEAIWVDYDNDGDKDLFVTVHEGPNYLFRNDGGLNMTDVSFAAFGAQTSHPSHGAVWADFNRDGWLDLYVVNFYYETGLLNDYWLNDGDGTFTNFNTTSVLGEGVYPTFDAVVLDINKDNWPDVYTTNDKYTNPNGLFLNNGGVFSDITSISGAGISINSMNAGGADYDNDGDLDLYCSNTPEGNVLLRNNGDETFSDATAASGTGFYRVGWASTFFDYNNDGWKDLYVSAMSDNIPSQHNALYVNQGNGTFTEPLFGTGGLGGNDYGSSLSHAIGDYNNDGHLDIAVAQVFTYPHLLWRNDETDSNNWIKVHLSGVASNTEGVGSWIELWADGQYQGQYTHCSMGYLGQNTGFYHFGLGSATKVDSIKVTWPSGTVDKLTEVTSLNQINSITEGQAALPVKLVSFELSSPDNKIAELYWSTSEEIGTDRFEIERSIDGRSFKTLGWVRAVGNSDQINEYQYEDLLPNSDATIYYRLKTIDFDGSFEYSPIRTIRLKAGAKAGNSFTVVRLPENPTRTGTTLNIGLESQLATAVTVSLVSRVGQVISSNSNELSRGYNELNLETGNLPAGSYFIRLETEDLVKSYQVVLTR